MAATTTPDLEKRAILAAAAGAEDDAAAAAAHHHPAAPAARSRVRPWLFVLVGVLLVLSIGATSHRCLAETSLFRSQGVSRVGHAHVAHHHQGHDGDGKAQAAVNSRSPTAATATTTTATTSAAAAPSRTVHKTFEVAQPVLMPDGPAESDGSTRDGEDYAPELCTVQLMRHDFAWSYNAPFVGNYTPPSCEFNRVVLNFSVVSQGRQFDRLAIMYFGDTEVWRTSTAEPTSPPGISWIYLKDMTEYLYFWKSPQKLIFDLGNLIDDKYTGIFNTTMTAIFYKADVETDQAPPSDLIIPISSRHGASNSVSLFVLPGENATNTLSLPRNIRRAVFSVSANGQATEEFWWSNVPQSDVSTFNATAGELPGLSPFREVQVLVDGRLAGVQWPFPVIFTGGVVPSLHRPIVGIHAFDLREHEIDVTPFLPLLCDGEQHTFTIRVAGLNDAGDSSGSAALTESVNENWYVTGKLFLWLDDDPASVTTGSAPSIHLSPPTIAVTRAVTTSADGRNETLTYTTLVRRTLQISTADLRTQNYSSSSSSPPSPATWSQSLTYTNHGRVTDFGFTQINDMLITGSDRATFPSSSSSSPHHHHKQATPYTTTYAYPLFCNSTYAVSPQGNLSISAFLRQGKEVSVAGPSVFPSGLEAFSSGGGKGQGEGKGSVVRRLETSKEGTAEFRQTGDGRASTGWGDARQVFWFGVGDGDGGKKKGEELYYREVEAVNGTVVGDVKRLAGRRVEVDVPAGRLGGGGGGGGGGKGGLGLVAAGATEYA